MSRQLSNEKMNIGDGAGAMRPSLRRRAGSLTLSAALMFPLAACGVNRVLPPPAVAYDYHDRHPIVVADAPISIDIFPNTGARLD